MFNEITHVWDQDISYCVLYIHVYSINGIIQKHIMNVKVYCVYLIYNSYLDS